MTTQSRKYRRRLHALPAAIALAVFASVWLYSQQASADTLLSANVIDEWNKSCRHCEIEPHYDVLKGEIIRLESRMGRALLSAPVVSEGGRPMLTWEWSVDEYDKDAAGALMRVTADFSSKETGDTYQVHYVWDPALKTTTRDMLGDNEFVWVVSGEQQQARRWYRIERDLTLDLGVLAEEVPEDIRLVGLEAGIGEPDGRKVRSGGYLDRLEINYLPEPLSVEPVATSD